MKTSLSAILSLFLLLAGSASTVYAAGSILVTPTRVVFEQRDRSAQVTIVNQGDQEASFRITFIRQNMTENGEFVPVGESEPGRFSDPMIRFSPRQVSLPPGQSQVIRLALRRPADLADGEYRSHMLFQALPDPGASNVENLTQSTAEGITIELIPIVGVSIPIIVRQGDLNGKVSLSDPEIVYTDQSAGKAEIRVSINRAGSRSIYGDLRATYTPEGGTPTVIAQANSVAVYDNMSTRRFRMPLNLPVGFDPGKATVDVVFLEPGVEESSGTLARTRISPQ